MRQRLTTLLHTSALLLSLPVSASNLLDDYVAATRHEPNFAAAQMQSQNMLLDARLAAAAYYPRANLSLSQDSFDNATRRTARIIQPIVSADRWLNVKESGPREKIAGHLDTMARYSLAKQVFGAVRDLAAVREKLSLNQANLTALQAQSDSAQMAHKLGQGTITDVLDTQVRVAQARGQIQRIQADLETARHAYANITGYLPAPNAYPLAPRKMDDVQVLPVEQLIEQVLQTNPGLQAQRKATELSAISARRARAQYLPTVNAIWQRSQTTSNNVNNISGVVISFDMPLQYGSQFSMEAADNNLVAQQQKERAVQSELTLETQRLHALALATQQEVQISRDAIDAAQMSLSANQQSFQGGVRSKIDVLNALQALLTAREAHLGAQLVLAESLLGLQLLSSSEIPGALKSIHQQFFALAP